MPKVKQKCVADGNRVNIREPFLSDLGLGLFVTDWIGVSFSSFNRKKLKNFGPYLNRHRWSGRVY